MGPSSCHHVAIWLTQQDLSIASSTRGGVDGRAVDPGAVDVQFIGPRELRLTVPVTALGAGFSSSEPWVASAVGGNCPPLGNTVNVLPTATPSPHVG